MDYNFDKTRLLILGVLLIAYFFYSGFSPPEIPDSSFLDPRRIRRAWLYCTLLFVIGAACVSIVDHYAGNLDPTNLRPLYIILGIILMLGAAVWHRSLRQSVEISVRHTTVNIKSPILTFVCAPKPNFATPAS